MTNQQAVKLPIGARIRRKGGGADAEVLIVERIERPENYRKADMIVYAGGMVFAPWEIERAEHLHSWPVEREGR